MFILLYENIKIWILNLKSTMHVLHHLICYGLSPSQTLTLYTTVYTVYITIYINFHCARYRGSSLFCLCFSRNMLWSFSPSQWHWMCESCPRLLSTSHGMNTAPDHRGDCSGTFWTHVSPFPNISFQSILATKLILALIILKLILCNF